MWAEAGKQLIRPFFDEHNGCLCLSDQEYYEAHESHFGLWKDARFLLKYGCSSEDYWNSEKILVQVKQAVTIAEINIHHPPTILIKIVGICTANTDDALNVTRMNVNAGGTKPKKHDTAWDGQMS